MGQSSYQKQETTYAHILSKGGNHEVDHVIQNRDRYNRKARIQSLIGKTNLPALRLFYKFPTFLAPDSASWLNNSFLNWFKSHGSAPQIKQVSCLRDL